MNINCPPHWSKKSKPSLAPCVSDPLLRDILLGGKDPANHVTTSSLGNRPVRILAHQPLQVLFLDPAS